jgi:signal transduction histidine kinase
LVICLSHSRANGIPDADGLLLKSADLNEANRSLAEANERLLSKTSELHEANRSLFESNHELAQVNKELADTNKRFAQTNRHFAEINKELTRVAKELALSNKMIEQQKQLQLEFINIAAHELRTPIMPIIGGLELLEERLSQISQEKKVHLEIKRNTDMINRNALRLKKLADDILQVSRIEGGVYRLNLQENVNIIALILTAIDSIKENYEYSEKRDKVSISLFTSLEYNDGRLSKNQEGQQPVDSKKSLLIKCDAEKIQQVVFNLLHNAMKFTEQGVITVNLDVRRTHNHLRDRDKNNDNSNNDTIIVSIEDQGTGVDPSIKEKLFEKFVTRSSNGAGLGLYLSKKIVEAHGGKIWVERNTHSNENERGTIFEFSLPVKNSQSKYEQK